jgi:hypothetical protein
VIETPTSFNTPTGQSHESARKGARCESDGSRGDEESPPHPRHGQRDERLSRLARGVQISSVASARKSVPTVNAVTTAKIFAVGWHSTGQAEKTT